MLALNDFFALSFTLHEIQKSGYHSCEHPARPELNMSLAKREKGKDNLSSGHKGGKG